MAVRCKANLSQLPLDMFRVSVVCVFTSIVPSLLSLSVCQASTVVPRPLCPSAHTPAPPPPSVRTSPTGELMSATPPPGSTLRQRACVAPREAVACPHLGGAPDELPHARREPRESLRNFCLDWRKLI